MKMTKMVYRGEKPRPCIFDILAKKKKKKKQWANFSPIISVTLSHQDIERIIFICQQVTCEQYKAINAKWLTKVHGSSESNYI